MDKPIAEGNIGTVGHYKVEFKGGKLRAEGSAHHEVGVETGAFIGVDSDLVIDAICKAIPGTMDDTFGAIVKAALKNV